MKQDEYSEWTRFQTFALGQLDYFADRQNFIGLSIDPSFEKHERLYVSKAREELHWTYKSWDQMVDQQRIFSTHEERMKLKFGKQVPTIEILRGGIGLESYQRTIATLGNLKLRSLVGRNVLGLDGTSYSIAIGDYRRESRYTWWEDLPTEWSDLEEILHELQNNMELARRNLK